MAEIPLCAKDGTIRAYVQVDDEDFDWLDQWTWRMDACGYAVRCERPGGAKAKLIHYRMHRVILGLPAIYDGREADHIDGDVKNNRRANLRACTHAENMQNITKAYGRSRYRGVDMHVSGQWRARARVNGRSYHVGYYDDEDVAGQAVAAFRAEHLPFSSENAPERVVA